MSGELKANSGELREIRNLCFLRKYVNNDADERYGKKALHGLYKASSFVVKILHSSKLKYTVGKQTREIY